MKNTFTVGVVLMAFGITGCNGDTSNELSLTQDPNTSSTPNEQNTGSESKDAFFEISDSIDEFSIKTIIEHLTGVIPAPLSTGAVQIAERGSTAGRQAAAQYMKESFDSMGVPAQILDFTTSSGKKGFNVEAVLEGEPNGRHLWVTAHLDSVSNAGASDDASGLASILMVARAMKEKKPQHTVHFVAYDLEEIGLVGSAKYFDDVVTPLRNSLGDASIIGNLHSDMIGYDPGTNLGIMAACEQGGEIIEAVRQSAVKVKSAIELRDDCLGRSDHKHFWDEGLSAVLMTDSSKYDAYPWYHEEGDTIDKLNFPYLQSMIQATAVSTAHLIYSAEI